MEPTATPLAEERPNLHQHIINARAELDIARQQIEEVIANLTEIAAYDAKHSQSPEGWLYTLRLLFEALDNVRSGQINPDSVDRLDFGKDAEVYSEMLAEQAERSNA